jgi:hypothetical protein
MVLKEQRADALVSLTSVRSGGKRQAAGVWVFLGAFLFFSICLPLGHVCLDHVFVGLQQTSGIPAQSMTLRTRSALSGDLAWHAQKFDGGEEDVVCQACLLAQNLLLDRAAVNLTVLRPVERTPKRLKAPAIAFTHSFQSVSKRAPPPTGKSNRS